MLKEKRKLILPFISIILIFIIGIRFEMDYRILTRKFVIFFADYKLEFYGGKEFRIFETDLAVILTLIPIGYYFTTRRIISFKKELTLILIYLILIPTFYCLYCFFESIFINIKVTSPIMDNEILKYHQDEVNYRMILTLTILSTFIFGIVSKRMIIGKIPINNN